MPDFKIFDYLDNALVSQESRDPKPSQTPSVWPSEASAERLEKIQGNIIGKCMRQSYSRMIGRPVSNQIDAMGAWKWVTGRIMETQVINLAMASDPIIYVANGVKHYVPDLYLPLELDLVVVDPVTKMGYIGECKTYDGYYAEKEIEKMGMPKLENLLQICLYLLEFPTGAKLKEGIRRSLEERARLDKLGFPHRNRTEAKLELLDQMSDGPTGARLLYLSRGKVNRTEFDVSIAEDPIDGLTYPIVNGRIFKIFTIESVYSRFKRLQEYWFSARREAVRRLESRGVLQPVTLKLVLAPGDSTERGYGDSSALTADQKRDEAEYLNLVVQEVWNLPDDFLPPAEYEWAYTAEKIELLNREGLMTKKAYEGWKKKGEKVGDWQCLYCAYKTFCVPKQNPNFLYMVYDLNNATTQE